MAYAVFLQVMTHLGSEKSVRFMFKGLNISIEKITSTSRWKISTKVFTGDGYMPPSIKECVSSSGILRWQEAGATLRMDPLDPSVFLIQEVESTKRYLDFRYLLMDFSGIADEWKEFFSEISSQDYAHRSF